MRELKFRAWDAQLKQMVSDVGVPPTSMQNDENGRLEVMQYTGLNDENGVEIYEGDIIKTGSPVRNYYVVEFHDGAFTMHLPGRSYPRRIDPDAPYEVIGNIYENPELLKAA